jgi:biotin/methionine sulfoxide reductase
VNEPWWTATAKRADIVFPATTPYEREDIGRTNLDDYLFHMPQLIPPVGEARDDYAIFAGLAERLGAGETFTEGRSAGAVDRPSLCRSTAAWRPIRGSGARSRRAEGAELGAPADPDRGAEPHPLRPLPRGPGRAPLGTPSGRIEIFSDTIDGFGYDDCPGHPVWLPPSEWLGAAGASAPLHLVSPQPGDKLHSQLEARSPMSRRAARDAGDPSRRRRAAGIATGDLLRVFNARGACRARALVSDDILPGVVALPTGAWFGDPGDNLDPHGNPNVLTRDVGTSRLAQGCSAHTALVEVARLEG